MKSILAALSLFQLAFLFVAASELVIQPRYGSQVWKIDDSTYDREPQSIAISDQPFDGEHAYIVLHAVKTGNVPAWNLHMWIGLQATPEDIELTIDNAIELSEKLGPNVQLYREVQLSESPLFRSYFRKIYSWSPHYMQESTKLYHLKGKKNVYVQQVPLEISSFNRDDCFVLDTGIQTDLFLYLGKYASEKERAFASHFSQYLWSKHRGPKGNLWELKNLTDSPDLTEAFFHALGLEFQQIRRNIQRSTENSAAFEVRRNEEMTFKRVFNNNGATRVREIQGRPIQDYNRWKDEECYVVDLASSAFGIGVLFGPDARLQEKQKSVKEALKILNYKQYMEWTPIQFVDKIEDLFLS